MDGRRELIAEALAALRAYGLAMGPGFERAHAIAQAHEGDTLFDRLHALCHRIEGDAANARYWYARARATPFTGSIAEEADALAGVALEDP